MADSDTRVVVMLLLVAHAQELRLFRCNNLVLSDQGLWGLLPLLPHLRSLAVEGLRSRVSAAAVAPLGDLRKVSRARRRWTGAQPLKRHSIHDTWR